MNSRPNRPNVLAGFPPASRSGAFSLIEFIAVLAILAILAATLLPAAIKRMDLRASQVETARLTQISDSLALYTLRTGSTPIPSAWSNAAVAYAPISLSQAAANSRHFQRIYYAQAATYAQTVAGLPSHPADGRAIIVSVLAGDPLQPGVNCPAPADMTGPGNAAFQALWDLPAGARPSSGLWANWNGAPDDFLLQRIDYAPLFHCLILVNRDSSLTPAFTIDSSGPQFLPQTNGRAAHYLDGTVLGLCSPDGSLTNRYILKRDISFVFEKGVWRCKIAGVPYDDPMATDFAAQAQSFMGADWNSGAFKGANQQGIVTAMYTFMLTYTFWADRYPHFSTTTTIQQVPEYKILQQLGDPQKDLFNFSTDLLK